MKSLITTAILSLSFISSSHAAMTYECTNKSEDAAFTVKFGKSLKSISVAKDGYSETGARATRDDDYEARSAKWKGAALYEFGEDPFGNDGDSDFLVSAEMLAGEEKGFAQYRNTVDGYSSITLSCRQK